MHKTMVSVASLEKIEIIRGEEFMPSEVRLKLLKKMIILGPGSAPDLGHFLHSITQLYIQTSMETTEGS